jgi:site-specific DNA-methyltransferase (adenine-specific)
MVQASTRAGDWCLDFFAGSGTLGAVAAQLGRRYVLIDSNPDAIAVMRRRLPGAVVVEPASGGDPSGDALADGNRVAPRQGGAERQ